MTTKLEFHDALASEFIPTTRTWYIVSNKNTFVRSSPPYVKNNLTFIARLCASHLPHTIRLIFKHSLPSLGPLEGAVRVFFLPLPESLAHIKVVRLDTRKKGKNEREEEWKCAADLSSGCFHCVSLACWEMAHRLFTPHYPLLRSGARDHVQKRWQS